MGYYRLKTRGRKWIYDKAGDEFLVRIMNELEANCDFKNITFNTALEILCSHIKENELNFPITVLSFKEIIEERIHYFYKTPKAFHPPYSRKKSTLKEEIVKDTKFFIFEFSFSRKSFVRDCTISNAELIDPISEEHITIKTFDGQIYSFLKKICVSIKQNKYFN
jgi:hypothetical protein